jgi:hypothetical protein
MDLHKVLKEDMQLGANGYFASKLNWMDPLTATMHVWWPKVTHKYLVLI